MSAAVMLSYEAGLEHLDDDRLGPDDEQNDHDRIARMDPGMDPEPYTLSSIPAPTLMGRVSAPEVALSPRSAKKTAVVKKKLVRDPALHTELGGDSPDLLHVLQRPRDLDSQAAPRSPSHL